MRNITATSQLLWILCFVMTFSWVKSITEIPVGFPCERIPNFCDRVTCAPPKNCQNGIIVQGAGNCGCCEACITYRDIGENCSSVAEVPAKLPDGVIAQYYEDDKCRPGLQCDATFQCQYFTSESGSPGFKECTYHQYECKQHQWEGKPSCDFYGDYSSKSCKGSSNPRCYCVDEMGLTIFGRIPDDKAANATCACSRAVKTNGPLKDFIRCDETGEFMPLQCWNHICFCVDPITKRMTSEAVPIAGIKALSCWDSKLYNATYYTPCTSEYLTQSGIVKEQSLKGMTIAPLDLPNCDPDGTYGFKQYDSNAYFCSDRGGAQIASYSSQEYTEYAAMVCNCARDAKYPEGLPDSGRGYKCDSRGNYVSIYCNQNICFCLDSDGQQSSDSFTSDPTKTCKNGVPVPVTGSNTMKWIRSIWMEQEPID